MASVVKIKRSAVQGKAPTVSDLQAGELALNTRDGKLFSANSTAVFEVGANVSSIHTGQIRVGNGATYFTLPTTDGTADQVLSTDGSGTVTWADSAATINDVAVNGNTTYREITVGSLNVANNFTLPKVDGTADQVLSTDGSGNVTWADSAATLNDIAVNGNTTYREITVGGLNVANTFTLPKTDGTSDQVLITDGSGNVTWGDQSGGTGSGYRYDYSEYTVGANTSKFSINSPVGSTLLVHHNGIRLANSDYTYSNTNKEITLDVAASSGDTIEVESIVVASTNDNTWKNFVFTANANQTLFSGTDDYGKILAHSKTVDVFLNGVQLIANTDYTYQDSDRITLTANAAADDTVSINVISPVTSWATVDAAVNANSKTTSAVTATVVDDFPANSYRSAKYVVQMTNNANSTYQTSEVLLLHDGSSAYTTEYAEVKTLNTLGTISGGVNSGTVELKVTPINADTTIKVVRTAIAK